MTSEIETVEALVDTDMDADEAQAITERIRAALEDAWELIKRAYARRAWVALGYGSRDQYCIGEFGDARLQIPREERPELVCSLRHAGMSIRAIASATGAGYGTVRRDLSREPNGSPVDVDAEDDAEVISERANERYPVPPKLRDRADWSAWARASGGEVVPITGRDGKRYQPKPATPSVREPQKPRRRPITDAFQTVTYDLGNVAKRIERLAADDRFSKNIAVLATNRFDIMRARDILNAVLDQLDGHRGGEDGP